MQNVVGLLRRTKLIKTMSKFNTRSVGKDKTINLAGGKAFKLSDELALYSLVATSFCSDKYYEGGDDSLERLRDLITKVSPEFVAKLAVYAREEMNLRSIPVVLMVELAKIHNGDNLVSRGLSRVVARADELTEVLAYYAKTNSRQGVKKVSKLSKQIQKGLAAAFNKFNEYNFAKYDRDNEISLRDALFLVHPKAKNIAQQKLFDKIVEGKLATPYTWEVELSELGQKTFKNEAAKAKAVKEKWEELIDSEKLGYMAMLRNLRNILQAGVDVKHLKKVASILSDKEQVENSKQFPFRFLSAYREIENEASGKASMILDALEEAMQASAANIKGFGFDTSVLIAVDTSGSMDAKLSDKSTLALQDVGLVMGMLLQNRCKDVTTGIFGDTWKIKNLPKNNILANAQTLHKMNNEVGSSTNGYLVIKDLIKRGEVVDKVMMFTDCQLWDSAGYSYNTYYGGRMSREQSISDLWKEYKKIAPEAKIYMFDLAGYGTSPISVKGDAYFIAGWSDKIFGALDAIENGGSALDKVKEIVL